MKYKAYQVIILMILMICNISACKRNDIEKVEFPKQEVVMQEQTKALNDTYVFSETNEANLAAITFLGYGNHEKEKNFSDFCEQYQLDKTQFVEIIDAEECEWYALIPKYKDEMITVSHVELNDQGELTKTEQLMTTCEPILLCCNVSDIIPSVEVTITYNDKELTFHPFISLEDGQLSDYEGIYTIPNTDWQKE